MIYAQFRNNRSVILAQREFRRRSRDRVAPTGQTLLRLAARLEETALHGTVAEVAVLGVAVRSRISLLWLQMSKKTLKHQPDNGSRNWASVDGLYSEFW
ncbi:hypothetical protein NQ318_004457 [Aromia moschata]|uniref:DUF4817 domain-containing protein n=1 Tax=Aromia moschata TaxID=1265417 RepID=A0AAV8YBP7_9CUCU|nr:hypothetical protein NQ318_004457 [Aromia moschata]